MTALALTFYVVFVLVAFGWSAWRQQRRTGDHGYRGFSGSKSPLERLSGVLMALALIALAVAGVASLRGFPAVVDLSRWTAVAGLALMIGGTALVLAAQAAMGETWRIGVDPGERTELIREGLFAVVRNPVFSAIGLVMIGFALLVPNVLSVAGLVAGAAGIELQARRIEEPHLLRLHGDAYAEYARRVGRFVPGVGRLG